MGRDRTDSGNHLDLEARGSRDGDRLGLIRGRGCKSTSGRSIVGNGRKSGENEFRAYGEKRA